MSETNNEIQFNINLHVIRMSFICTCMALVFGPYVTRIWSVCHSYVIRMSLVCTRTSSACHLYVPRMWSVCHSYVIRMSLVCDPYVTRMYSYVIRMSLVCGFTMNPYFARISLAAKISIKGVCLFVTKWP